MVLIGCICRSRGQYIGFQNAILKNILSETTRPKAFIFGIYHHLDVLNQRCSNYAPGVKIDPVRGVTILHWNISGNFQTTLFLNRWWEFDQTQQEWSLCGPLQKLFKWFWLVVYVGHGVKKKVFKMHFSQIFLFETARPRAFILGI